MKVGSFVNAELGGLSKDEVLVAQGVEPANATRVVAVHPDGKAGAVTASKPSRHCAEDLPVETKMNRNADTKEM